MRFLIALSLIALTGCTKQQPEQNYISVAEMNEDIIVMQRVVDTDPLAKQELVNRDAMQTALMDKLNHKEEELNRRFFKTSQQQRKDFFRAHEDNMDRLDDVSRDIGLSVKEIGEDVAEITELKGTFRMIASDLEDSNMLQNKHFDDMRKTYEDKLAFDTARIEREKEKENTIRGVVENMYADQDTSFRKLYESKKDGMLPPSKWVELEEAKISIHADNDKFENLMKRAINNAAINSGPWKLKWKIKKENELILYTKFSLDAETSFGEFANDIKKYMLNYNGVNLFFRVFKEKRILIVSDS